MRSSNPVLRNFARNQELTSNPVTYANIAIKSLFLITIVFLSGYYSIFYFYEYITFGNLILALVIGFISVIIGTRVVNLSAIFSFIYALCEGVVLGFVSYLYASVYEGIVPTALLTTGIVFIVMLLLYSSKVIKVNQRFLSVMVVALIAVIVMSLLSFVWPYTSSMYYLIVGLSALLSAFFLLMDFASIESCVDAGADSKYGWVLSLGLLVTLVWVYIEMLRILGIFARRN